MALRVRTHAEPGCFLFLFREGCKELPRAAPAPLGDHHALREEHDGIGAEGGSDGPLTLGNLGHHFGGLGLFEAHGAVLGGRRRGLQGRRRATGENHHEQGENNVLHWSLLCNGRYL